MVEIKTKMLIRIIKILYIDRVEQKSWLIGNILFIFCLFYEFENVKIVYNFNILKFFVYYK